MYSILTTVFLYLSYFVCLQLLLKFIQKKKKINNASKYLASIPLRYEIMFAIM